MHYILVPGAELDDSINYYDEEKIGLIEGGFSCWDSLSQSRMNLYCADLMSDPTYSGLKDYEKWWKKIK